MLAMQNSKLNDIQGAFRRQCVVGFVCLVLLIGVAQGEQRYVFSGYVDGGTTIERDSYTIVAPTPRGVLNAFEWREFVDRADPQNLIMNIGAGKNFSWAATVRSKGRLEAGETLSERAVVLYPKEAYSVLAGGQRTAQCVIKDSVDSTQEGYERFYDYVGLCSAAGNRDVYELIFSEMNLTGKEPSPGFGEAAREFFASLAFR